MVIKLSNFNILIFIMSIILYAGVSSKLVGPFRVSEFIILMFTLIVYLNRGVALKKIAKYFVIIVFIIIYGSLIGVAKDNPFILSDINKYMFILISIVLSFMIPQYFKYDTVNKIFYISAFLVLVIFIINSQTSLLTNYYFLELEYTLDHLTSEVLKNKVPGPSAQVLLVYFYIMITFVQKKSIILEIMYLFFTFTFYLLSGSRETFVMMFSVFALKNLYQNRDNKILIFSFVAISFLSIFYLAETNERFSMIFDPFSNTSFKYRLLSNGLFLEKYFSDDFMTILFGYGLGAKISLYLGSLIGEVKFVLMDNGPLTIVMKSGIVGLVLYIYIVLSAVRKLPLMEKIILLMPFIFSSILSSHIFTHFIYILGLFISANYIKYKRGIL